jgi:hypothetical protein
MGQQQLLLIILGVIIVGIAIAVGISQFGAHSQQANKDGLISATNNICANAYQFRIRPLSMGGGGGAYTGYVTPTQMATDDNGDYVATVTSADLITVVATSKLVTGATVTMTVDGAGVILKTDESGF